MFTTLCQHLLLLLQNHCGETAKRLLGRCQLRKEFVPLTKQPASAREDRSRRLRLAYRVEPHSGDHTDKSRFAIRADPRLSYGWTTRHGSDVLFLFKEELLPFSSVMNLGSMSSADMHHSDHRLTQGIPQSRGSTATTSTARYSSSSGAAMSARSTLSW